MGRQLDWDLSSGILCRRRPETYLPKELERAKGLQGVSAIVAQPRRRLFGLVLLGPEKDWGCNASKGEHGRILSYPDSGAAKVKVSALLIDRDGGLWVGTDNDRLFRIYKDKVDRFGSADGLSSDAVNGFYQDREGDVWVVTTKGIDRFRDVAVATFSKREGLTSEEAQAVSGSPRWNGMDRKCGSLGFLAEWQVVGGVRRTRDCPAVWLLRCSRIIPIDCGWALMAD